ncbi:hypothetical protein ACFYUK_03330 [Nonomuraea wenchangensis]
MVGGCRSAPRDADVVVSDVAAVYIIPDLGARKLRELSAEDVDRWLVAKAKVLSARTVRLLHSCLNRAVKFAQARDKVKRNVVGLCEIPEGKEGRPSKSLTLDQATALLAAAEDTRLYAYVVLSLLIGARTEELRALTWKEVDLVGDPDRTSRRGSPCGVRYAKEATPRPSAHGVPWRCPSDAWKRSSLTGSSSGRT